MLQRLWCNAVLVWPLVLALIFHMFVSWCHWVRQFGPTGITLWRATFECVRVFEPTLNEVWVSEWWCSATSNEEVCHKTEKLLPWQWVCLKLGNTSNVFSTQFKYESKSNHSEHCESANCLGQLSLLCDKLSLITIGPSLVTDDQRYGRHWHQ